MNDEYYNQKYHALSSLLLYFMLDTYLPPEESDDLSTIKRFVAEGLENGDIPDTLQQGREVLQLNPFPYEWIQSTVNRYPPGKSHETTPEDYYVWIKSVLDLLESEAIKAGKYKPKQADASKSVDR
jgi:hypothetical protein